MSTRAASDWQALQEKHDNIVGPITSFDANSETEIFFKAVPSLRDRVRLVQHGIVMGIIPSPETSVQEVEEAVSAYIVDLRQQSKAALVRIGS